MMAFTAEHNFQNVKTVYQEKPLLSWLGSKYRQPRVIDMVAANWKAYERKTSSPVLVLPFAGALGDLFALRERGIIPERVIANDLCGEVIGLYRWIAEGNSWFADLINLINTEKVYYDLRNRFNQERFARMESCPQMDDRFFYTLLYRLNKTGFNAVYRVSSRGYNVPVGRNAKGEVKQLSTIPELGFYRQVFKTCTFSCMSFEELDLPDNSFIYCDPPYEGRANGYNPAGTFDTASLFATCRNWVAAGHTVTMSNSYKTADMFRSSGFRHTTAIERRSVSCNGNRDDSVDLFGVAC